MGVKSEIDTCTQLAPYEIYDVIRLLILPTKAILHCNPGDQKLLLLSLCSMPLKFDWMSAAWFASYKVL